MFVPNPKIIGRFANARINGYSDKQFEHFMRETNGVIDYNEHKYDGKERLQECVSEIVDEPDKITNVNTFGDQQEYKKTMTDNLNNANFAANRQSNDITGNTSEQFEYPNEYIEPYTPPCNQMRYPPPTSYMKYPQHQPMGYKPKRDSFFDGDHVVSNKTIIVIIIVVALLLAFFLVIGIFHHKCSHLEMRIHELQKSLQPTHTITQTVPAPQQNGGQNSVQNSIQTTETISTQQIPLIR